MRKQLLLLMTLFLIFIGYNQYTNAIPNIIGEYSGTYSIDVSDCTDSSSNGTYNATLEINISNQTGDSFNGSATGTFEVDDLTGVEYIQLSGTIKEDGSIDGNTSHTFFLTTGEGTFDGKLNEGTLTITNTGHDTGGETCSYTREMIATKCFNVAVAIFRGGPITVSVNEPHNIALTEAKTQAIENGAGLVTARVFDANPLDLQATKVLRWLDELNKGCSEPIPLVLVGHSLGGDGAIKVDYENVCSRILLDAFDWDWYTTDLSSNQANAPPRDPPSDGLIYSFLAEKENVFQGRPLLYRSNVYQECKEGTDHNSIVKEVLENDDILWKEIDRCKKGESTPTRQRINHLCPCHIKNILPILELLLEQD